MARFGAGGIVARFGSEGKPDRVRKSRIFNYLGFGARQPDELYYPYPAQIVVGLDGLTPVVLVE